MLTPGGLVVSSAAVLLLSMAGTAGGDDGWGAVDCAQQPFPGCELAAGQSAAPAGGEPGRGQGTGARGAAGCDVVAADYHPPPGSTADHATGMGAWVMQRCPGYALFRGPLWLPQGAASAPATGGGGGGVSAEDLAAVAVTRLRLPDPAIAASPDGAQLVNLPTWLWIEGWEPQSATAAVPGVAVTATATPRRVVWSMGEGSTVTCTGAGTPFRAGMDPAARSPDCSHTYRVASRDRPGGVFWVRATVWWTVRWSGAGRGGSFDDLATSSQTALRVVESPAVNTG